MELLELKLNALENITEITSNYLYNRESATGAILKIAGELKALEEKKKEVSENGKRQGMEEG